MNSETSIQKSNLAVKDQWRAIRHSVLNTSDSDNRKMENAVVVTKKFKNNKPNTINNSGFTVISDMTASVHCQYGRPAFGPHRQPVVHRPKTWTWL